MSAPYNPHIMVFSNHVAALPPPRPADRFDLAPVTIFFGALNREADWADPAGPQPRTLDARRSRTVQVVYDRAFFDALTTPYKAFEPLCPYERYKNILQSADIALLPLEPTRFNRHKSDLKFIECAAHGVAALASPTVYDRTIRSGQTGLIYRSLDDFAAMLKRLIGDGPYRRASPTMPITTSPNIVCSPDTFADSSGIERCSIAAKSSMPTFVAECRSCPE